MFGLYWEGMGTEYTKPLDWTEQIVGTYLRASTRLTEITWTRSESI